jgi:hypothetical protein
MEVELLLPAVTVMPLVDSRDKLPWGDDKSAVIFEDPESSETEKLGMVTEENSTTDTDAGTVATGASLAPFTTIKKVPVTESSPPLSVPPLS